MTKWQIRTLAGIAGAVLLMAAGLLRAQEAHHLRIKSFIVGPDITLTYPNDPTDPNHLVYLPDEHTTVNSIFPWFLGQYLVFGAAQISGGNFGAVVLKTNDLNNFAFATDLGYNPQVLTSPLVIGKCDSAYDTEFDENYAAPGSVLQDPTLPPGNLIMLYEAENHCANGMPNGPFYATVGFTRSSDSGKTWPPPANGPLGVPDRYPVLQSSDPLPPGQHGYLGDAIPAGFIDRSTNGDYYLYISYGHYAVGLDSVGVARAKLGGAGPLSFSKWYNGSFSQPGIGELDTPPPPSACNGRSAHHPEISYNDDLGLYQMIFWCGVDPTTGANVVSWYYSTATSLDLQDWSQPQMIVNSEVPVTTPCSNGTDGQQFEGWYPSLMSPGAAAGHTRLLGRAFFLAGCTSGTDRHFLSRWFLIIP